jgi:hypothetical protein
MMRIYFAPLGRKGFLGVADPRVAREARLPWAILFHAVGVKNPPANAGGTDMACEARLPWAILFHAVSVKNPPAYVGGADMAVRDTGLLNFTPSALRCNCLSSAMSRDDRCGQQNRLHFAHPARANLRADFVASEMCACHNFQKLFRLARLAQSNTTCSGLELG